MSKRSLAEWLAWQETLNPVEIDLGLDRVRAVADKLSLQQPDRGVFFVAGTNGKGSVVAALNSLLGAAGLSVGTYTSPHLLRYNERVCINNEPVTDGILVKAFEAIDAVRGDHSLTYFEYGTLAAFLILSESNLDAWVVEVGLGGRLDATNVLEPDVSLITTIALDHEAWLGNTVEAIAREKAGIMRAGKPVLYGDPTACPTIVEEAQRYGASLLTQGDDFGFSAGDSDWTFNGCSGRIEGLSLPVGASVVQLQNRSLALAAVEQVRPAILQNHQLVRRALNAPLPPGRFHQVVRGEHEWILDVGHNPQAIAVLAENLAGLPDAPLTVVMGMLEDKQAEAAAKTLAGCANRWIVVTTGGGRGQSAENLAARLAAVGIQDVTPVAASSDAFEIAEAITPAGGRILVCGSFFIVGPALGWLTIDN